MAELEPSELTRKVEVLLTDSNAADLAAITCRLEYLPTHPGRGAVDDAVTTDAINPVNTGGEGEIGLTRRDEPRYRERLPQLTHATIDLCYRRKNFAQAE